MDSSHVLDQMREAMAASAGSAITKTAMLVPLSFYLFIIKPAGFTCLLVCFVYFFVVTVVYDNLHISDIIRMTA